LLPEHSEHHPLRALFLDYFVVIGQIVRSSLDAMSAIAGSEYFIDHA